MQWDIFGMIMLGVFIQILVQMQKFIRQGRSKEFSGWIWFAENGLPVIISIFLGVAFYFIAVEQVQEVAPTMRATFLIGGGYNIQDVADKFFRRNAKGGP